MEGLLLQGLAALGAAVVIRLFIGSIKQLCKRHLAQYCACRYS